MGQPVRKATSRNRPSSRHTRQHQSSAHLAQRVPGAKPSCGRPCTFVIDPAADRACTSGREGLRGDMVVKSMRWCALCRELRLLVEIHH